MKWIALQTRVSTRMPACTCITIISVYESMRLLLLGRTVRVRSRPIRLRDEFHFAGIRVQGKRKRSGSLFQRTTVLWRLLIFLIKFNMELAAHNLPGSPAYF